MTYLADTNLHTADFTGQALRFILQMSRAALSAFCRVTLSRYSLPEESLKTADAQIEITAVHSDHHILLPKVLYIIGRDKM